ncbi:hypothetical protein PRUPE_1G270400 [Prunus persica]|uniref:Uncharacterized protein n=1 Tax=Prunus persica TaxID=3760 RepID=A0A251R6N0_PRUPE|nr:hypothetical protein PRUPE_1G270400 [Prunus persica]
MQATSDPPLNSSMQTVQLSLSLTQTFLLFLSRPSSSQHDASLSSGPNRTLFSTVLIAESLAGTMPSLLLLLITISSNCVHDSQRLLTCSVLIYTHNPNTLRPMLLSLLPSMRPCTIILSTIYLLDALSLLIPTSASMIERIPCASRKFFNLSMSNWHFLSFLSTYSLMVVSVRFKERLTYL